MKGVEKEKEIRVYERSDSGSVFPLSSRSAWSGRCRPVLLATLPDAPTACCHFQHLFLIFLCPISEDSERWRPICIYARYTHLTQVDPLYAITFICHPHGILRRRNCPSAEGQFRIVHQLLQDTLDASWHPLTMAPKALRDIVLPQPKYATKTCSVTGDSGPTTTNFSAFSSPIPWRKPGCNSNDMYFDIVETQDAVVNK
jgi:AP-3 complex subunit mu